MNDKILTRTFSLACHPVVSEFFESFCCAVPFICEHAYIPDGASLLKIVVRRIPNIRRN